MALVFLNWLQSRHRISLLALLAQFYGIQALSRHHLKANQKVYATCGFFTITVPVSEMIGLSGLLDFILSNLFELNLIKKSNKYKLYLDRYYGFLKYCSLVSTSILLSLSCFHYQSTASHASRNCILIG